MKKIFLVWGLVVLSLFIIACGPPLAKDDNALAGQAVRGQVNANSCSKDDTCEVNNIVGNKADFKGSIHTGFLSVRNINDDARTLLNSLSVTNLAGAGNAFACVDTNGQLFRSTVPCPEVDGCWDRDGGNDQNNKTKINCLKFYL